MLIMLIFELIKQIYFDCQCASRNHKRLSIVRETSVYKSDVSASPNLYVLSIPYWTNFA